VANGCHENVAELWLEKATGVSDIGIGYALSEDGLWRQHSWAVQKTDIIETTEERVKYFGILLEGNEADSFAANNMGDPDRRRWEKLPEVWFRLERDDEGYPPKDWEGLKAEPTERDNIYRIKSVPFYAPEVAYEDEVRTSTSDEGDRVFESVVQRSGYSTLRLWIEETEDRYALVEDLTNRGCLVEFKGRLVAVGIPGRVFGDMSGYIYSEKERERWDAEDGYCTQR